MSGKKIALMNHSNLRGLHLGCARVMRLIEEGLEQRGCIIHARLDTKEDWRKSPRTLQALRDCDAIVINGEGTLHHGRRKAERLLEVATHELTRNKELSLINALWQDNPDSWATYLRGFRTLWARDQRSASLMARQLGREVSWMGDISTSAGAIESTAPRHGIVLGDSVSGGTSNLLCQLARELSEEQPVELIPLTTGWLDDNPYRSWLWRTWKRIGARRKFEKCKAIFPQQRFLSIEEEYLTLLGKSELLVTGRFHGLCLALVSGTPFVALPSNSWKIKALFEDVGIDERRLVESGALSKDLILQQDWSWSELERSNIAAFLRQNQERATKMFDAIAA